MRNRAKVERLYQVPGGKPPTIGDCGPSEGAYHFWPCDTSPDCLPRRRALPEALPAYVIDGDVPVHSAPPYGS